MTVRHNLALALLFAITTLAGCTSIQLEPLPEGMTDQQPPNWEEQARELREFDRWVLSGKMAVKQPSDSGSAVINRWQQYGNHYDLSLSSSFLGMGSTRIKGAPGFIELTLSNGDTYRSANPEQLLNDATGWQLPVDSLVWWLRGLPAPDTEHRLLFDQNNQLAIIEQNGWEIRYDRWRRFVADKPELPARITALKGDKRVRVVIADWREEK
ncbi:lipoprotein insertase outer membrane protein LolB [Marinobacter persicus]|uniref:Outer-membrane lipoprotein LolB n=1 Tax=Marinobacter persicus TaxID=930118 RepID=A0A2S6G812_9GAMM|nr:lipoprotein insertase outer membrane protein LolB [Marinobacter persicus]PPK52363.1 outer membrane lipoprotein LolB [Marinobacter persicus]PPK55339.1 outer membrane lipoprotein LolB [Marinobacter persicus]PPK59106.1 outer membrane lipoprotein LolB [Marinobacter persicus]